MKTVHWLSYISGRKGEYDVSVCGFEDSKWRSRMISGNLRVGLTCKKCVAAYRKWKKAGGG